MNKISFYTTVLFSTIFILCACSDEEDSATVYIPDSGTVVTAKFNISDKPYTQTFNVAVTSGQYPLPFGSGIASDIQVSLNADAAKLDAYNAEKGTSYKILPEGSYSFKKDAVIKSGSFMSDPITLSIDAKNKINPFEYYMLPISIQSVSNAQPDICHQTIYFLIYGSFDASDMTFLSRTGWKVVEVSSEELTGEGANNGASKYAFDGKGDTFWHTQWQNGEPRPPHHITVDMGKENKLQGFSFLTRDIGGSWPKECTIEVSNDGSTWEIAATFTDLPAAGATEFRSFFPKAKNARYFKMTITSVYGGSSTHVAEINVF